MPTPAAPAPTRPAVPAAPGSLWAAILHPIASVKWFWPAYMTPGRPGRATDQTELNWIYLAWLGAFLLKMLGSTWDVSWHFRWLRDDLAPPHLLNSAGTAIVVGLVIFHSYTGYGVDKKALRLMQWGIGAFLIAVPIDILNHRINGLDITSWSPSHGLLYLGTAIMLAGAIRGWWLYAAPGRIRDLVSLGLWLFFVENALFPNQHQEYGVLSLDAYNAGQTTAEPQLLDFAAAQGQSPAMFMLPVPSWVHPTWLICAGLLSLRGGPQDGPAALDGHHDRRRLPALPGGHVADPGRHGLPALGAAVRAARRRRRRRPVRHLPRARLAGRAADHRRRVRGGLRSGGRRPAPAVELVVGRCGWPSASPCCGRRWTCSSAAPGWPAGGPPRNPQPRRHPRRSDPRRCGAAAGASRLIAAR